MPGDTQMSLCQRCGRRRPGYRSAGLCERCEAAGTDRMEGPATRVKAAQDEIPHRTDRSKPASVGIAAGEEDDPTVLPLAEPKRAALLRVVRALAEAAPLEEGSMLWVLEGAATDLLAHDNQARRA